MHRPCVQSPYTRTIYTYMYTHIYITRYGLPLCIEALYIELLYIGALNVVV